MPVVVVLLLTRYEYANPCHVDLAGMNSVGARFGCLQAVFRKRTAWYWSQGYLPISNVSHPYKRHEGVRVNSHYLYKNKESFIVLLRQLPKNLCSSLGTVCQHDRLILKSLSLIPPCPPIGRRSQLWSCCLRDLSLHGPSNFRIRLLVGGDGLA